MYDVIIVGAGIAGLTAAIYLRRAEKSVLVLEKKIQGGQIVGSFSVENWPGEQSISGTDLTEKIYHQANNLGAEIKFEEVTEIKEKSQNFQVKTDEAEYTCGAVIIAAGAEPRKLSKKQTEDAGSRPISYCAICDGALYKNKIVVVVGSGKTADHEVRYLENIASKVYRIHHDDPIPKDAEGIFAAIGHVPTTQIFKDLVDLDEKGYIIADENCTTSHSGIFVAGDCRTKNIRQLVTAASDGAVAAEAAIKYLD